MRLKKTDRGFKRAEFKDEYGEDCSIQESSLATNPCIWLGVDLVQDKPARMHVSRALAKKLIPHLQKFVETGGL